MIDLITKENSFYAIYNEPFGDVLKAFLIKSPSPALLGMVADAPAPVDKEVTQIAKNVIQFAMQRIEISGVKDDPKLVIANSLNEIDRQLKAKKYTNGILCCSLIFIYDKFLYVGGVGDCTIALANEQGALRFCHDGPDEPRPNGVENFTIAPAELIGLDHNARLGDLPKPYSEDSVYQIEADPSLAIYMFSDGLTKHIPDFFDDLVGNKPDQVFSRVNRDIPKDTDSLRDDICFTVIKMPTELAPQPIQYPPTGSQFSLPATGAAKPSNSGVKQASTKTPEVEKKQKKQKPVKSGGFWVLFFMLLIIMAMIGLLGYWAVTEWLSFKSEILRKLY